MTKVVFDIEADGLRPTKIWCVCCYDLDTGDKKAFHEDTKEDCKAYLESADLVIGHNICMFDLPVLKKLWNVEVKSSKVYDTLVASCLADPKREAGHSLKQWGISLGVYKDHYEDWSHWTQEMEDYCTQDVQVTVAVYKELQKKLVGFSPFSIKLEMLSQQILSQQHYAGFDFDLEGALALKNKMMSEYFPLIQKLQQAFPPRKVLKGTYRARRKQDGTLTAKSAEIVLRDCVEPSGEPDVYNVYEYKEFMIDSPAEIRERMAPYWHPVVWNKPTKDGSVTAKVCDENLETVGEDAPEAIKDIVRCKILKSRSTLVQSFIDACWEDNRVHGDVISVGAASNRMAHRNPNTANIPSDKSLYGEECRALFRAPEGKCIVGCDAAGIQLRALAHYVNDKELIHQILNGDIHVHMAKVYGLLAEDVQYDETIKEHKAARSRGKTITYAILMGAGAAKIGSLAGGDEKLGRQIMKRLESGIKGWSRLKSNIEASAKKGYFKALDGRKIFLPNAHKGMSFLLQSFEACVMKYTIYLFHSKLKKLGVDFKQCSVVHDEVQIECYPKDADMIGETICKCFNEAGEFFKVNCRLDGEYKIGKNWKETH